MFQRKSSRISITYTLQQLITSGIIEPAESLDCNLSVGNKAPFGVHVEVHFLNVHSGPEPIEKFTSAIKQRRLLDAPAHIVPSYLSRISFRAFLKSVPKETGGTSAGYKIAYFYFADKLG